MSADNWAQCPRCKEQRLERAKAAQDKATAAYGKVSVEEFDALRTDVVTLFAQVEQSESERTFREDYEIYGADDGVVEVSYSGGCAVCGLSLSFHHTHPLDGLAT